MLNVELLEQPWVRSLFEGFCAWDGLPKQAGNMTARIDKYAVFFATIDRCCDRPSEVSQERLFALFGGEGLRRCFLPVSFLCKRLALNWDATVLDNLIEAGRINQLMETWRAEPWLDDLRKFIDELECGPNSLKPKTIRTYVTAAGGLLAMAQVESLSAVTQTHLNQFLRRHPGHAANLNALVRHLRERSGVALELKKRTAAALAKKEQTVVEKVKSLAERLEAETDQRRARAFLAALIASLYQLPIKSVLALVVGDVVMDPEGLVLWPETHCIRVEGRFAELLRRWLLAAPVSGFVFAGRNGVQPISYDAVRYQLQGRNLQS